MAVREKQLNHQDNVDFIKKNNNEIIGQHNFFVLYIL